MNANISETIKDRELDSVALYAAQFLTEMYQRKFVTRICHAHSNANMPPKPLATTIFMLDKHF